MSMNWIGCLYHSIQHDPSEKPRESPTLPPYVGCRRVDFVVQTVTFCVVSAT